MTRFSKTFKKQQYKEYLWLDYLEIRTLWSPDREMSINGFIDIVKPEREDLLANDEDDNSGSGVLMNSPKDKDKYERRLEILFGLARTRSNKYGDDYPFTLDGKSLLLKDDLSGRQMAYVYLLCCSLLSEFEDINSDLTSDFESLSLYAAQELAPVGTEIHISGRNTLGTSVARYRGNKLTKLRNIAKDLGVSFKNPDYEPPPRDTGDGGVDIVAWLDFSDGNKNKLILLAQSKCSEEWLEGGTDAYSQLKGIFVFDPMPLNYYFIPFCYRNARFDWNDPNQVTDMILVDRSRFLSLLDDVKITNFVSKSKSLMQIKVLMEQEGQHIFE